MTRLVAPLAGWLAPLGEVPDPVFADGMMGPGFAIDPTDGRVCAPCDGVVIALAQTGHSVTIKSDDGATILIHIGIDTVALNGAGFEAKTAVGARVAAGELLILFDLDRVARNARSAITPVLVIGGGDTISVDSIGRLVAVGDAVAMAAGSAGVEAASGGSTVERRVTVPMAHGIHARPAARIVAALKPFAAQVRAMANGREADARSTVGLMTLGAKQGAELLLSASGADAQAALDAVAALIESGMGETGVAASVRPSEGSIGGVTASPGIALGVVHHLRAAATVVARDGQGGAAEAAALDKALQTVRARLSAQTGQAGAIAAAHIALLEDPTLLGGAQFEIAAGRSAGHAWRAATETVASALRATGDALLGERVADLEDLEAQILIALGGTPAEAAPLPERAILIADELLPSHFMTLDRARIAGIATVAGGPTAHASILAAAAGIPMLVAMGPGLRDIAEGRTVLLDADARRIELDPDVDAAGARVAAQGANRRAALAAAHDAAHTRDGTRIEVFANLGSVEDAGAAVAAGAEGCGLLRTEFLFLERDTAPGEEEQARDYAAIAAALEGRPLIVRTLDNGGDKPVPYLPMPPEENPALGLRGVRLSLARPDLLDTQLRAILRGVPADQCRIMVPMVIELDELRAVRTALDRAKAAVGVTADIPLGVMIETPAAAVLAASIAREADFLSVGSNDLTQYALACDRGNAATAARLDALHPAVLGLIATAAKGAAAHGRWIGVCGGVASDPAAAAVLIGLGVTELSAAPGAVPAVKAAVRGLEVRACRALATRALACASAAEVRELLEDMR